LNAKRGCYPAPPSLALPVFFEATRTPCKHLGLFFTKRANLNYIDYSPAKWGVSYVRNQPEEHSTFALAKILSRIQAAEHFHY
jgi:hypothetical protein